MNNSSLVLLLAGVVLAVMGVQGAFAYDNDVEVEIGTKRAVDALDLRGETCKRQSMRTARLYRRCADGEMGQALRRRETWRTHGNLPTRQAPPPELSLRLNVQEHAATILENAASLARRKSDTRFHCAHPIAFFSHFSDC